MYVFDFNYVVSWWLLYVIMSCDECWIVGGTVWVCVCSPKPKTLLSSKSEISLRWEVVPSHMCISDALTCWVLVIMARACGFEWWLLGFYLYSTSVRRECCTFIFRECPLGCRWRCSSFLHFLFSKSSFCLTAFFMILPWQSTAGPHVLKFFAQ